DAVFITHFHADHWLGLPGMIKSFALRDRSAPLAVYGPRGLAELMSSMRGVYGRRLPFELSIVELEPWEELQRSGYTVAAVPVNHGGRPAQAYALVKPERPGEFDPGAAERLGVSPGPAFGRLQRGETVAGVTPAQVMGPPRQGRRDRRPGPRGVPGGGRSARLRRARDPVPRAGPGEARAVVRAAGAGAGGGRGRGSPGAHPGALIDSRCSFNPVPRGQEGI